MNKQSKKNYRREHNGNFQRKQYLKYCGSTDVPCFLCYLTVAGEPQKETYYVRAIGISRFIDQQIRRNIMNTVLIADYVFHELPHGTLFVTV